MFVFLSWLHVICFQIFSWIIFMPCELAKIINHICCERRGYENDDRSQNSHLKQYFIPNDAHIFNLMNLFMTLHHPPSQRAQMNMKLQERHERTPERKNKSDNTDIVNYV